MPCTRSIVQCISRLIDLGAQIDDTYGDVAFALRITLDAERTLLYHLCKGTEHEKNPLFSRYMK